MPSSLLRTVFSWNSGFSLPGGWRTATPAPGQDNGMPGDTDFATLDLADSGLRRLSRVPASKRPAGYDDRFDATTLWVDAVWRDGVLRLICPRLNNLRGIVRRGTFAIDGRPARPRIRQWYRHAVISIPAPARPSRVSVTLPGWRGETTVHGPEDAPFAGRNVLATLSKDDDPAWIEDWVRFHVRHHGADAVLFVDNGSTRHSPAEIDAAILRGGVAARRVLRVPLSYGPRGDKPYANAELYLQTCVLNALRCRFLRKARAVLANDVDELIHWPGGSVFDAAVHSRWGYVAVDGHWVYPPQGWQGPARHGDHGFRAMPPAPCPQKWCIVPEGPLRRFEWRVHHLERLPAPWLFRLRGATLFHCRAVTQGWKSMTRLDAPHGTEPDPVLADALAQAGVGRRSGAA